MEPITRSGRYVTLRDYVRVVRRYRWAILALAIIGAAAGYGSAKREQTIFTAGATIAFQDPGSELALVGYGSNSTETAADVAQQYATTLTSPAILQATERNLHFTVHRAVIAGALSGQSSGADLLLVDASSPHPVAAKRIANAAAAAVVAQSNGEAEATFKSAVVHIKQQIASLTTHPKSALTGTQLAVYEDELARLTPLTKTANTAQVVEPAAVPSSPTSPKPKRDALIGLMIGAVVALLIAFLRDSLDRRLRTARDIEACLQLPIVGHVRQAIMGRVPYLAKDAGDHAPDIEAARILRRNLEFLSIDHPPRSVLITSGIPGEGKTTVAASLAFALAAASKRVLLVEGDLRRPVLASRLALEPTPGLSEYLAGEASPEQILRSVPIGEDMTTSLNTNGNGGTASDRAGLLACIPAGSPTSTAAELVGSARFAEFLCQVRNAYDIVIIDSTPLLPVADAREILPHVDAVVVCARENETKREEALAAKAALARFPARPTGVVITGVRPERDDTEVYSYSYT